MHKRNRDCDSDSDCMGELRCKQRSSGGPVPGCNGHETVDAIDPTDDFCYDPNWVPSSWVPPKYFGYNLKTDSDSGVTFLEHDYREETSWFELDITVESTGVYPLSLRFSQPRNTEGDIQTMKNLCSTIGTLCRLLTSPV